MADLKTRDLKGVELLAVGTWDGHGCPEGGCVFTSKDIDGMVEAHKKSTQDAPVKLGHGDKQRLLEGTDMPAVGWIENLRRVGQKLIGDLVNVPQVVAELIDSGAYRKRSLEFHQNEEIEGKTYRYVVTALALLGATQPAVEGLKDIRKLYAALELELDDDTHAVLLEQEDEPPDVDTLVAELDEWLRRAGPRFRGKPGSPTIQQLQRALKEGLKRTAKASKPEQKGDINVDEEAIRKLLSIDEDADIVEAITGLQTQLRERDEADPARADLAKTQRDLSETQARILTMENNHERALLEARQEKDDAEAKQRVDLAIAEGRIAPRNRELALSFARKGTDQFDKFVGNLPGVDLSERGSSAGDLNLAELEPTPQEIKLAEEMGVWNDDYRKQLIRDKAAARGVAIPQEAQPAEQKA